MSSSQKVVKNILLVRPDRIGDVLLSIPALKVLRSQFPNAKITFLVRKEIAPLVRLNPELDEVLIYDPKKTHQGFAGLLRLIQQIRKRKVGLAFVLQNTWFVSLAVYLAGVKNRVGPYSHFHSYLFFNYGKRQRRSQVEMHEAEYNLDLLSHYGLKTPPVGSREVTGQLIVPQRSRKMANSVLSSLGWNRFVVVHPGMRGSAENWKKENYIELIQKLLEKKINVFLSFGPEEDALMSEFQDSLGQHSNLTFYGGAQAKSLSVLSAFYERASLVVAPSTGPLHIAVSLGRPVVSFYPTIKVQSVKRWGPFTNQKDQAFVFEGMGASVVDVLNKVCETMRDDDSIRD